MSAVTTLLLQRIRWDRWQLLIWLAGLALLAWSAQVGVVQSYGTAHDREVLLQTVAANPVILLFRGLPSGAGGSAFMLFLILPWLAMLAAFATLFLTVRHTRGDEEQGRAELVGATPAGRTAPLTATLVHGAGVAVLFGIAVAGVYLAVGLAPGGSLISGAAVAMVGLVFLAVGAVAAQLMRTGRGANSLGVWVLLIVFLLSGIGNALGTPSTDLTRIESSWLAWASPFGWAEQTRPFADDAWVALLPGLLCAAVLGAVAYALHGVRDLDASLVPERAGRTTAPASLRSAFALDWRLSRASLLGWAIGGFITGLLATGLASVVREAGAQIPAVQTILRALAQGGDMDQGMVVIFFLIAGVLAACFAVQTVSRARQEEARGTAELLRAAPVHRVAWLGGFLGVALIGVVAVLLAAVAGAWLGARGGGTGVSAADAPDAASLLRDAAVSAAGQAVAAAVFAGLTSLVFALLPRLTIPLGWLLVVVALGVGLFGPLFGAPDWVTHLSPFALAPIPDGGAVDPRGLWGLAAVAVAGTGLALLFARRRELASA